MNTNLSVVFSSRVLILNPKTKEVFVDKSNAIHPQNMSRIIARALAHEPNSWIYRLALGNGGIQTSATGAITFKEPNDGTNGSGWASRLYNETYSEIVDAASGLVGTDPGSADSNNIRPGGGALPMYDPAPDSVISQEVGTKSNVIVSVYINQNEPTGQLSSNTIPPTNSAESSFVFNELGLYTSGLEPLATSGYASINVNNQNSESPSNLSAGSNFTLSMTIDGTQKNCVVQVPVSGTGPLGQITYGDICEGLNSGAWIVSGDPINNFVYTYITDFSNGIYPSILNAQSYGLLTFQSRTTGVTSNVTLSCNSGNINDLINALSAGVCANANFTHQIGTNSGVQNDSTNPQNEGERLLTHLIFDPITKTASDPIQIIYTITVSVAPTVSSLTNITSS